MLVGIDERGGCVFPFRGKGNRADLALVEALGFGFRVFLLRSEGELVRLLARDAEFLRHVVAGLGHRMVAELLDHLRVREARADGGVEQLHVAAEGRVGLGEDVGRAACRPWSTRRAPSAWAKAISTSPAASR